MTQTPLRRLAFVCLVVALVWGVAPTTDAMGPPPQTCENPTLTVAWGPGVGVYTDCIAECDQACGDLGLQRVQQIWDRANCWCTCCP